MEKEQKTPARRPVRPKVARKKSRRRARRNPALQRFVAGQRAGLHYRDATERFRPSSAQTRALFSPIAGGNERTVKRLGSRMFGGFSAEEMANVKRRRRRVRRRNAVLSQEARRRGLFAQRAAGFL